MRLQKVVKVIRKLCKCAVTSSGLFTNVILNNTYSNIKSKYQFPKIVNSHLDIAYQVFLLLSDKRKKYIIECVVEFKQTF